MGVARIQHLPHESSRLAHAERRIHEPLPQQHPMLWPVQLRGRAEPRARVAHPPVVGRPSAPFLAVECVQPRWHRCARTERLAELRVSRSRLLPHRLCEHPPPLRPGERSRHARSGSELRRVDARRRWVATPPARKSPDRPLPSRVDIAAVIDSSAAARCKPAASTSPATAATGSARLAVSSSAPITALWAAPRIECCEFSGRTITASDQICGSLRRRQNPISLGCCIFGSHHLRKTCIAGVLSLGEEFARPFQWVCLGAYLESRSCLDLREQQPHGLLPCRERGRTCLSLGVEPCLDGDKTLGVEQTLEQFASLVTLGTQGIWRTHPAARAPPGRTDQRSCP